MHPLLPRRLLLFPLIVMAASGSVSAAPPPNPPRSTLILAVDSPATLPGARTGLETGPQAGPQTGPQTGPIPSAADSNDPLTERHERRAAAIRRLEATGDRQLAPLLAALEPLIHRGQVQVLGSFPAFGMLAVSASPGQLEALRAAPGLRNLWRVARRRLAASPAIAIQRHPPPRPATFDATPAVLGIGPAPRADHLERIGAPAAWNRVGGLGEGLVIGIIDSGADGRHPILANGFRGHGERRLDHDWVDLTAENSREPTDGNGHGTHVTGLALGAEGDQAWGAAPGARWIAARAFDAEGNTDDLTLLKAADWMLHPGARGGLPPDPAHAPDIVNLSWTLDNGADDRFQPVIQAFRHADILAVCATGNLDDARDPWNRLLAPASYPEALAVGALSLADEPWLWGRLGPGFFGGVKPQLLAPGEAVWSALPDGETGSFSGSSMAAPLVSGAAAVVWGQGPRLRAAEVAALLSASARGMGAPGPEADIGWGKLDLSAAVDLALRTGWVEGIVTPGLGAEAAGRSGAVVSLKAPTDWPPAWQDLMGRTTSDSSGTYRLIAPAGRYLLRVTHPLALPLEMEVVVTAGQGTRLDLQPEDSARIALRGRVRGTLGTPVSGATLRLSAADDPAASVITFASAADGSFDQPAPAGDWLLWAEAEAHRVLTTTVRLRPGMAAVDVDLAPAPKVLLVDADAWDDERIAPYLSRALDDAGLPHSRHDILLPQDLPATDRLAAVDLLWWAHTYQSPGRLDQERKDGATVQGLSTFLAGGGQLLLSGQDIALWDQKRGLAKGFFAAATGVRQSRDRVPGTPTGLAGLDLLNDLALDAAWADGAAKIRYAQPDSLDLDEAVPAARAALRWADGSAAAVLRAGDATFAGRRAFLGFGPESAGGRLALARVVDRLARWMTPPDLRLAPVAAGIAPGQALTATLRLRGGGAEEEAQVTVDWPPQLQLADSGQLVADGATRATWQGRLAAEAERRFDFSLRLTGPVTGVTPLLLSAVLRAAGREHRGGSWLTPQVPDLRASRLTLLPTRLPTGGGRVALHMTLVNNGTVPAASAAVTVSVPAGLTVDPSSLRASTGQVALDAPAGKLTWRGDLAVGGTVTLDWDALAPAGPALILWQGVATVAGMADLTLATELRVGGPRLRIARLDPPTGDLAAGAVMDLDLVLANDGGAADAATADLRFLGSDAAAWSILTPPGGRWTGGIAAGATVAVPLRIRAPEAPRSPAAGLRVTVDDGLSPAVPVTGTVGINLRWPDLASSQSTYEPDQVRAADLVSVTVRLANNGTWPAEALLTDILPPSLVPLTEGLSVSSGTVERLPGQLRWRCRVAAGGQETLRYSARAGGSTEPNRSLTRTVRIDGGRDTVVLSPTLHVNPWSWSAALSSWPVGAPSGGTVEQGLHVRGRGLTPPRSVALAIDLPRALAPDPRSLPPGLVLAPDGRSLRFDGPLGSDGALRLDWRSRVVPGLEPGGSLYSGAKVSAAGMPTLALGHRLSVSVTDWSRSSLTASRLLLEQGQETELRLQLENGGPRADRVDLVMAIPSELEPDPSSLAIDGGPPAVWDPTSRRLTWQGDVAAGDGVTVRLRARLGRATIPGGPGIPLTLVFNDGHGIAYRRDLVLASPSLRVYLPWQAVERR